MLCYIYIYIYIHLSETPQRELRRSNTDIDTAADANMHGSVNIVLTMIRTLI